MRMGLRGRTVLYTVAKKETYFGERTILREFPENVENV
jgi:hypothetical protein